MPRPASVADFEASVADTPRLTLLYLGTRNLDRVDTIDDILDRSGMVSRYVDLIGGGLDPGHLREFLSTVGHVYQALSVRLRKIEDAEAEAQSRHRGGV